MSITLRLAMASILLAAAQAPAHAARHEIPGYTPADVEAARALPIYVVIDQPTLRPEITYGYQAIPQYYGNYANPGVSAGQYAMAGIAGGLIASAIINGAAYVKAKNFARPPFQAIQQAHCNLAIGPALGEAIAARVRTSWPGAAVQTVILGPGQKFESAVDVHKPRFVVRAFSSLATDFSAVVTSIDAEAYPLEPGTTRAARTPAWRDSLIAVSDRVFVEPVKSKADVDVLSDLESRRFVALDLDDRIRKVNADGRDADRRERKQLYDLLLEHDQLIKDANAPEWTPTAQAMRRAIMLSEQQCQRLDASVLAATTLADGMLGALADGSLPLPVADAAAAPLVPAGERQLLALPGHTVVSAQAGNDLPLGFRYSLLAE